MLGHLIASEIIVSPVQSDETLSLREQSVFEGTGSWCLLDDYETLAASPSNTDLVPISFRSFACHAYIYVYTTYTYIYIYIIRWVVYDRTRSLLPALLACLVKVNIGNDHGRREKLCAMIALLVTEREGPS